MHLATANIHLEATSSRATELAPVATLTQLFFSFSVCDNGQATLSEGCRVDGALRDLVCLRPRNACVPFHASVRPPEAYSWD